MKPNTVASESNQSDSDIISVNWSLSLPVIVLDDITHGPDGAQVLIIAFRVDIVEGLGSPRIPVRACEVNGNLARVRESKKMKIQEAAQ